MRRNIIQHLEEIIGPAATARLQKTAADTFDPSAGFTPKKKKTQDFGAWDTRRKATPAKTVGLTPDPTQTQKDVAGVQKQEWNKPGYQAPTPKPVAPWKPTGHEVAFGQRRKELSEVLSPKNVKRLKDFQQQMVENPGMMMGGGLGVARTGVQAASRFAPKAWNATRKWFAGQGSKAVAKVNRTAGEAGANVGRWVGRKVSGHFAPAAARPGARTAADIARRKQLGINPSKVIKPSTPKEIAARQAAREGTQVAPKPTNTPGVKPTDVVDEISSAVGRGSNEAAKAPKKTFLSRPSLKDTGKAAWRGLGYGGAASVLPLASLASDEAPRFFGGKQKKVPFVTGQPLRKTTGEVVNRMPEGIDPPGTPARKIVKAENSRTPASPPREQVAPVEKAPATQAPAERFKTPEAGMEYFKANNIRTTPDVVAQLGKDPVRWQQYADAVKRYEQNQGKK
jgi:hypothetical protein